MVPVEPSSLDNQNLEQAWKNATARSYSLNPQAEKIPGLDEVIEGVQGESRQDIARGLVNLAVCSNAHFPENIFFDVRYLATWLDQNTRPCAEARSWLSQYFLLLQELFTLFGNSTPIRFRYVHDFLYGYDWSRWIQKHPEDAQWHPYSLEFLHIMQRRGHEILAEIHPDHAVYPPVGEAVHRNRFAFNREPEHERALLKELAATGRLPMEAWASPAGPLATTDFHGDREQVAQGLACGHKEERSV